MAIRSIIEKITKDPDATVINVLYTDDVSFKTQKEYRVGSFNLESFKRMVQSQIDAFGQVDNVDKVLFVGDFDTTPVPPTAEQQARIDYAADIQLFGQMNSAIAAGAKKADDQDYIDVKARLEANFIDSYIDLF